MLRSVLNGFARALLVVGKILLAWTATIAAIFVLLVLPVLAVLLVY
ncbi:hypothetical protein [Streptomyces sp. NPDC091371]